MLYCRYRNGRLEAELPSGEIIGFEDMDELREFIEQRRGVSGLVGRKEVVEFDASAESSSSTAPGGRLAAAQSQNGSDVINVIHSRSAATLPILGKAKKIRIHKGVYTVENGKLIKEKTA